MVLFFYLRNLEFSIKFILGEGILNFKLMFDYVVWIFFEGGEMEVISVWRERIYIYYSVFYLYIVNVLECVIFF